MAHAPEQRVRWRIDSHWNQYRSNNQGFRSDIDFDRLESLHRIVVVGDSFGFGTGVDVEETFAALLDTRLGDDTAVCDLSMPGFGMDQMWMSVRHQAVPVKPALVIVAFVDDDLDRSLTAYRRREGLNKPTFELEGGTLRPQRAGDTPDPFTRHLERHSSLWAVLRSSVRALDFSFPIGDWWSRNEAIFRAILEDGRNSGICQCRAPYRHTLLRWHQLGFPRRPFPWLSGTDPEQHIHSESEGVPPEMEVHVAPRTIRNESLQLTGAHSWNAVDKSDPIP